MYIICSVSLLLTGIHFNVSIPTINLTRSDNMSANGTFDVSITSFDNNTDGVQFMLKPSVGNVTLQSGSEVNVTLRNLGMLPWQ